MNMFIAFSMTEPGKLAEYAGFTTEEVRMLCVERNLNYEGFQNWYDGYRLSEKAFEQASPAYYNAQNYYIKVLELATGKGYADLVYLPSIEYSDKPALLIELKYNKNVEAAIAQIHRQNYPQVLEKYKGNILLVGLNYNRDEPHESVKFKHHTCVIERA